jgi:hypothetical protein
VAERIRPDSLSDLAPWSDATRSRPAEATPTAGPTPAAGPGTWVEIHRVVLSPGERAPQIPDDTKAVPLEMRVKGFLVEAAAVGEEAEILTRAGRRLRGTLVAVNPAYTHGFGAPIPELSSIGQDVRAILRQRRHPT